MSNTEGREHSELLSRKESRSQDRSLLTSNLPTSFPTTRKRKRADIEGDWQSEQTFHVQAHPSLPSQDTKPFTTHLVIPRSCLPLAYLDPTCEVGDALGSRLFSGEIEALDEEDSEECSDSPKVLIARSTEGDGFWAIERVQHGFYALCKLCAWVTPRMFKRLEATPWGTEFKQARGSATANPQSRDEWWQNAVIKPRREIGPDEVDTRRLKRLGDLSLCLRKPVQTVPPDAPSKKQISAADLPQVVTTLEAMVSETTQGPTETLDMLKQQYREALYASKTPLAYFAKGPLSRARAAFQEYDGSSLDRTHLTQFLRSCILPLTTADVKFRETLPNLTRDLPFGSFSDDEGAPIIAAVSKKARKSKRSKVDKNGLYPGEEVDITRWWIGRDTSTVTFDSEEERNSATKAALLEQRVRETQMQIILSLETLALELSAPEISSVDMPRDNLPGAGEDSQKKSKKPKKPQNLETLLDMLADRLSIWHSMDIEENTTSNVDTVHLDNHESKAPHGTSRNDGLRQFCVDIVLPFYGARLTKLATTLCAKLGGPKQPSPNRPPLAKAVSSHASRRPGPSQQREKTQKPRRTLERVLTSERSVSQRPPPSLTRSVTEPVLSQMKRETSDVSLSTIPLNRVAMHKRREVDFHAASQATESRLKQKARVEQELQSAIAALKKPNPRMAVKELVEDAEKRVAGSRSRKSKNPMRNPFAQSVQVMATPSKNRHSDIYPGLPRLPRPQVAVVPEVEEIPPSSIHKISDSTRKAQRPSTLIRSKTRHNVLSRSTAVEQTPTRGPSKFSGRPPSRSTIPANTNIDDSSALQPDYFTPNPPIPVATHTSSHSLPSWPPQIQGTPCKTRPTDPKPSEDKAIQETPSRVGQLQVNAPNPFPTAVVRSSHKQETSIYARDDDDVDELL